MLEGRRLKLSLTAARAAAQAHAAAARLPFFVLGEEAGSVARAHVPILQAWAAAHASQEPAHRAAGLRISPQGVWLDGQPGACEALLDRLNSSLRIQALITGWRDEKVDLPALTDARSLLRTERAAARFWGSLTLGAHATGYVLDPADPSGRPTQVWVAQRAQNKATDPGMWDNLIGGGVPAGQSPFEALVREGWEEAGLPASLVQTARLGARLHLLRDVDAGLQRETLHSHDLALPPGMQPVNQDGEVQRFCLLPIPRALALAHSGQMTLDAAWVMLDFAERWGLGT